MNVRLLAEAEEEAQHAARWYEERKAGLGQDFLDALANALQAIEDNPQLYPLVERFRSRREVRQCPLNRFPFAVVYEVLAHEILVLAVAHLHRRPHYWKRRRG